MRFLTFVLAALVVASGAHAAPPPLEAYASYPAIRAVALSASGDRFAIAVPTKSSQNVIVRTATGAPVAALGFKIARIDHLEFAGEDHLLIFETAPEDEYSDRRDVVDFNLKTRASFMLLHGSNVVYEFIFGWHGTRQIGGRWYAYVGGVSTSTYGSLREHAYFPDLYRVDLDTGKIESVAVSAQRPRSWLIGADGQILANTVFDPSQGQWTLYAGAGADRPLLKRTGADNLEPVGLGRTPGSILVSERVANATSLRELQPGASGDGVVLTAGEAATGLITDRDSDLLVGLTTVRDQTLFSPILQKRIDVARQIFPDDRSRVVAHSRNFDRVIFRSDGPKNAGRYWLFDAVARTASPLSDIYPQIAPADVGPSRMFAYKAADGLAMEGVLTLPPGRDARNLPLVVMPHGGPIVAGDQPSFDWWAQAFASRGYAVFQPNYRGSLGYGDAFRNAANGEFGRKMQTDVSDGVTALAAAGIVDPKRTCIVGASYGGYAALAGVTLQQGLYRCAVSLAGVSDMNQMMYWERAHSSRSGKTLSEQQWKTLTGSAVGAMGSVSPTQLAAKADAPVLLLHGENDYTVPIEQSQMMRRALASAGKPVEYLSLGHVDHYLDDPTARLAMLNASVAFVEKHNPAN